MDAPPLFSSVVSQFEFGRQRNAAAALYFVFYNFCRVHKTLGATPAMAAGLVDKVLKMSDVVALIDAAATVSAIRGPYKKRTVEKAEISN